MTHLYLKAVHLIFIVTWFSGLFYIPRLFVYLIESAQKPEPDKTILSTQLRMMTSRLWYGITWPSAIVTLIMGASMIIYNPSWLSQSFMHIKLSLVTLLYGYHLSLHFIFRQLQKGIVKYTSTQMRMWNEVASLFLISIVFLIVLKSALSMAWGIIGLGIVSIAIVAGIRVNRILRKK